MCWFKHRFISVLFVALMYRIFLNVQFIKDKTVRLNHLKNDRALTFAAVSTAAMRQRGAVFGLMKEEIKN